MCINYEEKYEKYYLPYVLVLMFIFLGLSFTYIVMYLCVLRQLWKRWKGKSASSKNICESSDQKERNNSPETHSNVQISILAHHTTRNQAPPTGKRQFPYKTLIWLILTVVFIVTYFLYGILNIRVSTRTDLDPHAFALFESFYRLYFINNIINPIVYAVLDEQFRNACKGVFSRRKAERDDSRY